MKKITFSLFFFTQIIFAQTSYAPQAGTEGSTAISVESDVFVAWATGIEVERGFLDIANPSLGYVTAGEPNGVLGAPNGSIVSLGDKGSATLTFENPIYDGPGYDFAVVENGFVGFLELAVVEVSSDGINFFGFPTHSLTQTQTQVGPFSSPAPQDLNNIAGKYINGYGTPFDLSEIENNPLLNKQSITHVKVIDVVGSIDPLYGTLDSQGNYINDPYPTPFPSGGFDLQAVGVINEVNPLSTSKHNKNNIKIYPNPTSNILNIQSEDELTNADVYNVQGQKVLSFNNSNSIDVSSLQSGVYILKAKTKNGLSSIKFVKR